MTFLMVSKVIPSGMQQSPYYSPLLPPLLNFATIGSTIGHEFSHAFDTKNVKLNAFGERVAWQNRNTRSKYHRQVNCLVRHYSKYRNYQEDMCVNGRKTVNENFADNGALSHAFYAYQFYRLMASHPLGKVGSAAVQTFERLPGGMSDFTAKQLFFISYASTFCANQRSESFRHQIATSPYPPNQYRINGAMSNFEPFAQAFKCKKNCPMNPQLKCQFW